VRTRLLAEDTLYEALSAQHGLPLATLRSSDIDPRALRSLPEPMRKKLQLIPFRLDASSQLWIAGPEAPAELLSKKLARFQRFEARFVLITPSNYQEIAASLSRPPPGHEVNGTHAGNGEHIANGEHAVNGKHEANGSQEVNGRHDSNGKTALAPIGLVPTESQEVYRAT
jgi:hypothetical protein